MRMHLKVDENYGLVPVDEEGIKYLYNRKVNSILVCDIKQERNYKFHKKLFSLFKLVHDNMPEPEPVMFRGELVQPEHNFDITRKFLTVQAGYYDVIGLPNGKVRVEAKSLAFNKMNAEDFEKLYSAVIDASLKVLPDHWDEAKINKVATEIINYV